MSTGLAIFTLVHVAISLIGIVSGFLVLYGLLTSRRLCRWTAVFLTTTVLTSVTGYFFPVQHLMPSHIVGFLSLILLTVAIIARYPTNMAGPWQPTYVITAILSLYLNFFVLIVQSFLKIPALHSLAPTQTEAPFKLTQLVVLVIFIALIVVAVKKFKVSAQTNLQPMEQP